MSVIRKPPCAFSLLEVVVAIGILAAILVALLGSLGPAVRSAGATADAQVVARLADNIQSELERLQADLGLDGLAADVPPAGSATALQLVATRDGQRLLRADGPAPAADRALNDPTLPGIAWRDRYFLGEVTRQIDLPYAPGAGFLAVSVRVTWPFRLPEGPPVPGATDPAADPSREVPANERGCMVFNFVLRP